MGGFGGAKGDETAMHQGFSYRRRNTQKLGFSTAQKASFKLDYNFIIWLLLQKAYQKPVFKTEVELQLVALVPGACQHWVHLLVVLGLPG